MPTKQKIILNDKKSFLEQLPQAQEAYFAWRTDHHNKLIVSTFSFNSGEIFVFVNYSKDETLEILFLVKEKLVINLFDLKKFCYVFDITDKIILSKFIDLKICFARENERCGSLNDEKIKEETLITIPFENKINFFAANSNLSEYQKPYQLLELEDLIKNILAELEVLIIIKEKFYQKEKNANIIDIFNKASLVYANIEKSKITILNENKKDVSKILKFFSEVIDETNDFVFAKIKYELFNSITERTYSKFHQIKKEDRKIIVCQQDKFMSVDFINFETKLFLDLFKIKSDHHDIYTFLSKVLPDCDDREQAKGLMFKFMYGGHIKNSEKMIINQLLSGVADKVDKMKECINEKILYTRTGKKLFYENIAEAQNKIVNAEIQNTATLFMHELLFNIYLQMRTKGYKSKIVATIIDEIVFDVKKEEVMDIIKIIENSIISSSIISQKYITLVPEFRFGNNLGELK